MQLDVLAVGIHEYFLTLCQQSNKLIYLFAEVLCFECSQVRLTEPI